MIFSLEALQADEGDCLLLHYGPPTAPKFVLIDGGPAGTYKQNLGPRLGELAPAGGDGPQLELVMVSHIDGDHISGVLDLFGACAKSAEDQTAPPARPLQLWHNAFRAVTGLDPNAPPTSSGAATGGGARAAAVAASVPQGRRLNDAAGRIPVPVNDAKGGLIQAADSGTTAYKLDGGLHLTVVHPDKRRLDDLRKLFAKHKEKHGHAAALAAAYTDDSVPNLSSIVVLAELAGKRMLLTGDARGDDVLKGLERAGLLKPGKTIELDLLKVPHHGSYRNVKSDFFERIIAHDYVISADGKYGNPDTPTLEMLAKARAGDNYAVHLTNHDGKKKLAARLDTFLDQQAHAGNPFPARFRQATARSLTVDLLDHSGGTPATPLSP